MGVRKWALIGAGALAMAGAVAGGLARRSRPLPALTELHEGWNVLRPGGEESVRA